MSKQKISIVLKHKSIDDNYILFSNGHLLSLKTYKYLTPSLTHYGYETFTMNKIHYYVHKLLGQAFIPNPDNKPFIDHIDRNKSNNDMSNLRWATKSENNRNIPKRVDNITGYDCICKATEIMTSGNPYHCWRVKVTAKGSKKMEKKFKRNESDTIPPDYVIQCRDEFKKLLHVEFSNI
jgi:hypothetical protein